MNSQLTQYHETTQYGMKQCDINLQNMNYYTLCHGMTYHDMIYQGKKTYVPGYKHKVRLLIIFFIIMWLFTVISKSVYAMELPMVETEQAQKKYVEHKVEAEGLVIQGKERAVTALAGLRVQELLVREGDTVEEGMPLFQIDIPDLEEQMQAQNLSIAELVNQIADIKANQELDAQRRQLEETRAREDYEDADTRSETNVSRAEEARIEAGQSLDSHLDDPVSITSDKNRDKAWDAYESWKNQKEALEQEIADILRIIKELENHAPSTQGSSVNTGTEDHSAAKTPEDNSEAASAEIESQGSSNEDNAGDEKPETVSPTRSSEDQENELEEAKAKLRDLQDALAEHQKNEVTRPDFSGEDAALKDWEAQSELLGESIEQAEDAVEDAHADRDRSLLDATRNIEDALFPERQDSTLEVYEMELAALRGRYDEFDAIFQDNGIIYAQSGGIVTDILISVGGRIPGTAAMLLTDDTVPFLFRTIINNEQKKYLALGDSILVNLEGYQSPIEATIDYLAESPVSPGSYEVNIALPQDVGIPGMSGSLQAMEIGEMHPYCIPISALYEKDKTYYVYVVREREGILGPECYAEITYVQVVDKNQSLVAIEGGVLDEDTPVIISSSDALESGDVVRLLL